MSALAKIKILSAVSSIICLMSSTPAFAQEFKADTPKLEPETNLNIESREQESAPLPQKVLNGSVSALGAAEIQTEQPQNRDNLSIEINGSQLKSLIDLFINGKGRAIRLMAQRPRLTSEQYRAMNYGVLGMNVVSHNDSPCPVVAGVYPTCPAALAGIMPGDLMVKANGHVFQPGEGQAALWHIVCGKADTPVTLTIMRQGQLIDLNLMRMNIEDIKDNNIRGTYEDLLSNLGAPGENRAYLNQGQNNKQ